MATARPQPSFEHMAYRHTTDVYSTDESSSESGSESDTDGRNVLIEMNDEGEDEWRREEGKGGEEEKEDREVDEDEEQGWVGEEEQDKEGEEAHSVWTLPGPGLNQLPSQAKPPARASGGAPPRKRMGPVDTKTRILQEHPKARSSLFSSLSSSSTAPLASTSASALAAALPPSTRGHSPLEITKTTFPLNGTGIYPTAPPRPAKNATSNSKQMRLASTSTPTPTNNTGASINNMFTFTGHPNTPNTPHPDPTPSLMIVHSPQDQDIHIRGHSEPKPRQLLLDIPSTPGDEVVAAYLCNRFPVFEAMHEWMQLSLLHPEGRNNFMGASSRHERTFVFNRAAPQLVFERPWRSGRYRGTGSD